MNCGFNYSGCGCNSYNPFITNPFGCGGCNSCNISSNGCGCGCGGFQFFKLVCHCLSCILIINHLWKFKN